MLYLGNNITNSFKIFTFNRQLSVLIDIVKSLANLLLQLVKSD